MDKSLRRPRRDFDKRFARLLDSLRAQILTGALRPGDTLTSENDLAEQFSLSRNSVRLAIQELVDEGLVVKAAGRGSFVTDAAADSGRRLRVAVPTPSFDAAAIVEEMNRWAGDAGGVTIDVIEFPVSNFEITARTLSQHGGADAILVNESILAHLAPSDLEAVNELLDDRGSFLPSALDALSEGDRLHAIPLVCAPTILALDGRLDLGDFDRPLTWRDIHQISALSDDSSTDGFTVSLLPHRLAAWLGQHGATVSNSDGAPTVDSPPVHETIDFLLSLVPPPRTAPSPGGLFLSAEHDFATGITSGVLTTTMYLRDFDQRSASWTLRAAPVDTRSFSPLVTLGLAIPRSGTDSSGARSLARWLCTPHAQHRLAQASGSFAARTDVDAPTWTLAHADAIDAAHLLSTARPLSTVGDFRFVELLSEELLAAPFEPGAARHAIAAAQQRAVHRHAADDRAAADSALSLSRGAVL